MFGMGRKKQVESINNKPISQAPKAFAEKYGGGQEEVEYISKAVEGNESDEDAVNQEIEEVQKRINHLKTSNQIPLREETWKIVKRIVSEEKTFLVNTKTGKEYILEDEPTE